MNVQPWHVIYALVSLSFWLFAASLPPVQVGLWVDSEFVLVCTYALAGCIGISLTWQAIHNKNDTKLAISLRSTLFLLTAGVSLCVTLWVRNPYLHHWGAPMLGEGTTMMASLSLLSLGFDQLHNKNKAWLAYSACAAGLCATVLMLMNNSMYWVGLHPTWAPYTFAAFLGPIAVAIMVYAGSLDQELGQEFGKYKKYALLTLAAFTLIISHNKTLWATLAVSAMVWPWLKASHPSPQRTKALYAFILCIPIATIACNFIGEAVWNARHAHKSDIPHDIAWSLRSRALSIRVYVLAWLESPLTLLTGHGWASYCDHLQQYITHLPIKLYNNGAWRPNWDGVDRIDFHVMHQGLEHLFSLGVLGLALYLAMLVLPLYHQKNITFLVFIATASFGSITSTWFSLACTWPFWLFTWFIIRPQPVLEKYTFIYQKNIQKAAVIIFSIISLQGSWNQWETAALYTTKNTSWLQPFTYTHSMPSTKEWARPYHYHGFHMAYHVFNIVGKKDYIPQNLWRAEIDRTLDAYNPHTSPVLLDIGMLHAMKALAHENTKFAALWKHIVFSILDKARYRSDMAETWVQYCLLHHNTEDIKSFAEKALNVYPNDPCAKWYLGLYHAHTGQKPRGITCFKQAVYYGAEKWIPTSRDFLAQTKSPLPE